MLTRIFHLSVLIVCFQFPLAHAGFINLAEADSGAVTNQSLGGVCMTRPSAGHSSPLGAVRTSIDICGPFGSTLLTNTWGYFVFDLATVTSTVTSAAVSITIDRLSGVFGALELYDYSLTSADDLVSLPTGPLSLALAADIHTDISSGNLLGSESFSEGDRPGVYDLALSSFALGQINAATGRYAIGVSYSRFDFEDPFRVQQINFGAPAQLKLELADNVVPAPTTLALLALGMAGLGFSRRAQR